ncbi:MULTISPECIES: helix-turn-helix domain-containing protein [Clostridium]|uniref:helix-turn-helix domain-containing protein n=1 Tax=Clostridium TaxID=1485 RepID=UPI000825DFC9|nr:MULTISPECIES: helix-turn-helix domain-containing protein [Clostridium]PJI08320.1 hypothetical protein CUB90_10785 [Clostridium sp. CT7]
MQRQGFTFIYNNLLDNKNLSIQEQSLLIAVLSYYDEDKGYSSPNYRQLIQRSKIRKDNTIIKTIKSLINKGFIRKETVKGKGCKYYISNNIIVTPQKEYHHKRGNTVKGVTPIKVKDKQDIYSEVFNYWNDKGITKASSLNTPIKKGIDKMLKLITLEDIKRAIDTYSVMYEADKYKAQYRLTDFLNRKDRTTKKPLLFKFIKDSVSSTNAKVVEIDGEKDNT